MALAFKTLIIRFSSIGDVVLSSPLLRALRVKFPQGQIDYVTRAEYAELVKSNHNLNYTYEFDAHSGFEGLRALKTKIKAEQYDLIVDIHDSLRSKYLRSIRGVQSVVVDKRIVERTMLVKFKKNRYSNIVPVADRYMETVQSLGIENDGKGLELHIPDEILFGVSGKIARLQLNRFERTIALCPGAKHFTKRWPAERYAKLGARIAQKTDAKVLVFGGIGDAELCDQVVNNINQAAGAERATDFSGQLTLLETAAAMEYCDLVVTNDSGLMHIAIAMKKKLIAIAGSTVREFGFFPTNNESIVLERQGLYCRPCSHIGRKQCPEGHFRCMNEIGVDEVFAGATESLRQS